MSRGNGQAFERELAQVEALIAKLDELPDQTARESARELIQVVLGLHARGLGRMLEVIAETDPENDRGAALIQRLAADDSVRGLLLLHDLHPDKLEARVRGAVERLRPHLGVAGVRVNAIEIDGESARLRLRASDQTSAASVQALKQTIEDAMLEAAPDLVTLHIEGLDEVVAFVSLASIKCQAVGKRTAERGP